MKVPKISTREKEVLHLIAYENSTKQIAGHLFISPHTVISHRKNLMSKLDVTNVAGLVRKALQLELVCSLLFLFVCTTTFTQNEMELRTDGIVVPRVNSDSVSGPVLGQVIYDTVTAQLMYCDGVQWKPIGHWSQSANDIYFDGGNVGIGTTSPTEQLEITGNLEIPVTSDSSGVIMMGGNRFLHNYNGNFFAGNYAGNFTVGVSGNTGVGNLVLQSLTTGAYNTALGQSSLLNNTSGLSNSAVGAFALTINSDGICNSAFGHAALASNTDNFNSAFGYSALLNNFTGYNNTAIGAHADVAFTDLVNATAIGYGAKVAANNSLVLGGIDSIAVNVGIGTVAPSSDLEILGPGDTDAITIDSGRVRIRHHPDFLVTDRSKLYFLMDADDNDNDTQFGIHNNLSQISDEVAPVLFNLDGGQSWIKSGDVGIGTEDPSARLEIFADLAGGAHLLLQEVDADGFARMWFRNTNADDNRWVIAAKPLDDNQTDDAVLNFTYSDSVNTVLKLKGNGNATLAGSLTQNSDKRLKKDIRQLSNAKDQLKQISGYSYYWKNSDRDGRKKFGLIAQEVQEIFPELVETDDEGYLSVNYIGMIPWLLEAIKDQRNIIDEFTGSLESEAKRVSQLENELDKYKADLHDLKSAIMSLKNSTQAN